MSVCGPSSLTKGFERMARRGIAKDAETGSLCGLCGISATSAFKPLGK